jgi:hypothetical protein
MHLVVKSFSTWLDAGHGSDEFNCAEFCPTSHHFTVNGHEVAVNFTEAGTQWGCTKHVSMISELFTPVLCPGILPTALTLKHLICTLKIHVVVNNHGEEAQSSVP